MKCWKLKNYGEIRSFKKKRKNFVRFLFSTISKTLGHEGTKFQKQEGARSSSVSNKSTFCPLFFRPRFIFLVFDHFTLDKWFQGIKSKSKTCYDDDDGDDDCDCDTMMGWKSWWWVVVMMSFMMNDNVDDNNYCGCKFFLNDITQWKRKFE